MYPKEQSINTENLKTLNDILDSTTPQNDSIHSSSALTFYLKPDHNGNPNTTLQPLKKVIIPVGAQLSNHMHQILLSRGVPVPPLPAASRTSEKRTDWDESNSFHAATRPFEGNFHQGPKFAGYRKPKSAKRVENLKHFLANLDTTSGRQGLRARNDAWNAVMQTKTHLCSNWGFRHIDDRSGWSSENMLQLLDKLSNALDHHKDSFKVSFFEGFSILIADDSQQSAVSAIESQIILSPTDPPGVWMGIFNEVKTETIKKAQQIHHQLSLLQKQSSELQGMEGIRFKMGRTCSRSEYLHFLTNLCHEHSQYVQNEMEIKLEGQTSFHVAVEKGSRPMLKEDGQFQIGSQTPFCQLLSLMKRLGSTALDKQMLERNSKQKAQKSIQLCMSKLKLQLLLKEPQVSWVQMDRACTTLIDAIDIHQQFLEGKVIRVGNIFSVTSKGDLRIPWEWY